MGSKEIPTVQLSSADDVLEHFADVYRSESEAPPKGVLDGATDSIALRQVPTHRYTCPDYAMRERKELWQKVWQVVCWGGDIPSPGDTKLYDNAGISAIIVRQQDGGLKAFYNSCLHRGMRLCNKEGKRTGLTCRFHGFSWDTSGRCQKVPQAWDFPQLDEKELCLPELAVDEWMGFVFVHPDPNAQPLDNYLGGLTKQWQEAGWNYDNRFKPVHITKHIRCNWKVAQEAFMEGYHSYAVHPHSIVPAAPYETMRADVFPDEPHFARGMGSAGTLATGCEASVQNQQKALDHYINMYMPEFKDRKDTRVSEQQSARDIMHRLAIEKFKADFGADLSQMKRFDVIDYCYYNVFPNFMPWPTLGYPLVYWFRPGAVPSECTMDIMFLVPHGEQKPPSAAPIDVGFDDPCETYLGAIGAIIDEDMANLPLIQSGLEGSRTGQINLSDYLESRIRHFHQTLGHYVPDGDQ